MKKKEMKLMDFLWELVIELLMDGGVEIGLHSKVSKWIRYPILLVLFLAFVSVIGGIFCLGVVLFPENVLGASLLLLIDGGIVFGFFYRLWQWRQKKKNN